MRRGKPNSNRRRPQFDQLESREMFTGLTGFTAVESYVSTGFAERGFNPQPEPPAYYSVESTPDSGLSEVGFNPQPEPPTGSFLRWSWLRG